MSSSYSENIKLLPQRLPVAFKWKDCPAIKGVLIRDYYGLHIIPEGSKEPKHLRHVWNSLLKEHEKDATIRRMLQRLSELDLLGHLTYSDTSVSFKTILTTYTPDTIRALAQAEDEPGPYIAMGTLEQERIQLIKCLEPGEVYIETHGHPRMLATLEANGTFTWAGIQHLSSFSLLHRYKMKHDPILFDIEEQAVRNKNSALVYIRFVAAPSQTLAEKIQAKTAPPPAPAPAAPGPIISEEVRLKENTALAKLFKTGEGAKRVFLRCIKVDCTAYLQPSGTFSETYYCETGFKNLHSLELLHRKNYMADYDFSQKTDTTLGQLCIYLETDTKMEGVKRLFLKSIRKHIIDLRDAEKKASANATSVSANATAAPASAKVEVAAPAPAEAKVEIAAPAPAEAKVEVPAPPKVEVVAEAKVEAPPLAEAKVEAPAQAKVEASAQQEPPAPLSVQLKALEEKEAKLKSEVEMLLFERKAKEQAVHQAQIRVAQLEADLAKIKADLA
jgi:hypothetical protein